MKFNTHFNFLCITYIKLMTKKPKKPIDLNIYPIDDADANKKLIIHPMLPTLFNNVGMIGSTKSGKTTFLCNLLRMYGKAYDIIFLFSSSYHADPKWQKCKQIKEENVINGYDDDVFREIVETQQQYINENKKTAPKILIILDDIGDTLNKHKSLVNDLSMRNRQLKINLWVSIQKMSKLSPTLRNNIINWMLWKPRNNKEKQFILDELTMEVDEDVFERIFDGATKEKYSFLHMDTKADYPFRKTLKHVIDHTMMQSKKSKKEE